MRWRDTDESQVSLRGGGDEGEGKRVSEEREGTPVQYQPLQGGHNLLRGPGGAELQTVLGLRGRGIHGTALLQRPRHPRDGMTDSHSQIQVIGAIMAKGQIQ